jgi:hypothetical protein
MRLFFIVCVAVMSRFPIAAAMEVDGVKVHGRIHDVSVADIREAIETGACGIGSGVTASDVDVISGNEMRIQLAPRDLGWALLSRQKISLPDGPDYRIVTRMRWKCRCKGADDPDVLTVFVGRTKHSFSPCLGPISLVETRRISAFSIQRLAERLGRSLATGSVGGKAAIA